MGKENHHVQRHVGWRKACSPFWKWPLRLPSVWSSSSSFPWHNMICWLCRERSWSLKLQSEDTSRKVNSNACSIWRGPLIWKHKEITVKPMPRKCPTQSIQACTVFQPWTHLCGLLWAPWTASARGSTRPRQMQTDSWMWTQTGLSHGEWQKVLLLQIGVENPAHLLLTFPSRGNGSNPNLSSSFEKGVSSAKNTHFLYSDTCVLEGFYPCIWELGI